MMSQVSFACACASHTPEIEARGGGTYSLRMRAHVSTHLSIIIDYVHVVVSIIYGIIKEFLTHSDRLQCCHIFVCDTRILHMQKKYNIKLTNYTSTLYHQCSSLGAEVVVKLASNVCCDCIHRILRKFIMMYHA